jgi:hypothetical protein
MLSLAGSAVAREPAPPPVWLQTAMDQFISACYEGSLRTSVSVQEVTKADLPGAVRRRYSDSFVGRFYRLGDRDPSYLVQVTSNDPSSEYDMICGLAVPGSRHLPALMGNVLRYENAYPRDRSDPQSHATVSGSIVGGMVLLQVSHFSAVADPPRR